jgi:hypothetical protein
MQANTPFGQAYQPQPQQGMQPYGKNPPNQGYSVAPQQPYQQQAYQPQQPQIGLYQPQTNYQYKLRFCCCSSPTTPPTVFDFIKKFAKNEVTACVFSIAILGWYANRYQKIPSAFVQYMSRIFVLVIKLILALVVACQAGKKSVSKCPAVFLAVVSYVFWVPTLYWAGLYGFYVALWPFVSGKIPVEPLYYFMLSSSVILLWTGLAQLLESCKIFKAIQESQNVNTSQPNLDSSIGGPIYTGNYR